MAGLWACSHLTFATADIDAIFDLRQDGDIDVSFPPKAYMHFLGDHSDFVRRRNLSPAPSGTTAILQGYWYLSGNPASENILCGFLLGSNYQCCVKIKSNRTLQAYRGGVAGTALGSASSTALPHQTDTKIGFKCVIDTGTAGSIYVVMKVAGVETVLLNVTGVNTQNEAGAGWDGFDYEAASAGHTYWTDVIVMDGSGVRNNDLLDLDYEVWPFRPESVGTEQQWTPDSGWSFSRVADTVQDGDTSYLASSVIGDKELFEFEDVDVDDEIAFVVLTGFAKLQSGSGAGHIAPRGRYVSTSVTDTSRTPGASYSYAVEQPYDTTVTGIAWTPTTLNAHKWGVERTSTAGTVRLTQLALEVVMLPGGYTPIPASCSDGIVPEVDDPPGGVEFEGLGPGNDRVFIELDLD